jgi:thiol:disulfide interchange protein DsbC
MKKLLFPLLLLFIQGVASADEIPASVTESLNRILPGYNASDIKPSPVPGLYEFTGQGRVLYLSGDGRYIISGNIIDIETKQNLTELAQSKVTKELLDEYPEDKMIVFDAEGETRHVITVFTDVDCPYCHMLHKEVPKLNKAGVKVRYLMYPRAGVGSPTYYKSVSTWCSENQKSAIGIAKNGGAVPPLTCDNPVDEQLKLGELIGVTGTPTLVLESGKVLPGYVPYAELIKFLDSSENADK